MSTFSQFAGGGGIKSIQRGEITIAGGTQSQTATITSVNTAKSELRFLGAQSRHIDITGSGGYVPYTPRIVLTNATTITAQISNTGSGAVAISWELTEWN